MSDPRFDLLDELPAGRLSIQASAGTGKTFTLAALATRMVAEEGVVPSELLVVTFTRAATSELRSRVRERLVDTAAALAGDGPVVADDPVVVHLAAGDRALHHRRLSAAVAEFDAATVTTIHGFAAQLLAALGVSSGVDADAALLDDTARLAAECCADELAAMALAVDDPSVLPKYPTLVQRTRTAIALADVDLVPDPDDDLLPPGDAAMARLVVRSIERMRARRRSESTMSFEEILSELRRAVRGAGAATTLETIRSRYRVALIDEFQDTDPVQWDIFRTIFPLGDAGSGDGARDGRLVLVGDPKQAIYAFRGANVHTYLSAVEDGAGVHRRTLSTNWRSDGAVLSATEALLDGVTFGDERIAFDPVAPAPAHATRRLGHRGGGWFAPLSLRLATAPELRTKDGDGVRADAARPAIWGDLVAEVRELLDEAELPDGDTTRPLRPDDIAVLVRSNSDADQALAALTAQGIPTVLARGGSVLDSEAAEQWRWLLDAMMRPSDPTRVRNVALSWFGGRDAEWVATAGDDDLAALGEQLHGWVRVLARHGVGEFRRRLWAETSVAARVLERAGGDRDLTDLDHVAELLGASGGTERLSPAALRAVLDAPEPEEIEADVDPDVVSRRIESEDHAVTVMTVWVSKGLEFPVVMVPTMWSVPNPATVYVDPDTGRRTYDVTHGGAWPDKAGGAERKDRARGESVGENLRLLYVALTRARHRTVVWWTGSKGAEKSGLSRVLFGRDDTGVLDPAALTAGSVELPAPADAIARLEPLVARGDGLITVTAHGHAATPDGPWRPRREVDDPPPLEITTLDRRPDRRRRRWSFTAITARDHSPAHGGPPPSVARVDPADPSDGDAGAADETVPDSVVPPVADDAPSPSGPANPFDGLPAGASFGTLVHEALEGVDLTTADLAGALEAQLRRGLERRPFDLTLRDDPDAGPEAGLRRLVDALRRTVTTPLGPRFGGRALSQIPVTDRLDELEFDLRLGDGPRRVTDRDVGRLVESHLAPATLFDATPLHDWATGLVDGRFAAPLAGHLTGSIDAVVRVHHADGDRFVVVDYKTNRLHRPGAATGDDYSPERLAVAMAEHHYPLQALLYTVALHRYLRWRLVDYDPDRHLGGVGYLFLRGLVGPDTPTVAREPHGLFSWTVPTGLVTELSDLLDGRLVSGGAP